MHHRLTTALVAAVTAASVIVPASATHAATAVPVAAKSTKATPTIVVQIATNIGEGVRFTAKQDKKHPSPNWLGHLNAFLDDDFLTKVVDRSSLRDKNHNGYDDDGKVTFRISTNSACLTLKTGKVTDHACGTKKRPDFTPLQTAAHTMDEDVRLFTGGDNALLDWWSTDLLTEIARADIVGGVRATVIDRNRDGYDDDGRVEFAKNGKKVCLTLPATGKAKSKVTFGKCPTTKRDLPKHISAAFTVAALKSDLKQAAAIQETWITDHYDTHPDGFAFTSTYAKPYTKDGQTVTLTLKGEAVTGTVKKGVGYCLKATHPDVPNKARTIWYDSAAGGIIDGDKPRGGAC